MSRSIQFLAITGALFPFLIWSVQPIHTQEKDFTMIALLLSGMEVTSVEEADTSSGFLIKTNTGPFEAFNVVVATGTFQKPIIL